MYGIISSWGYFGSNLSTNIYVKDYQGNICAVVDGNGNNVQTTQYYPYGTPTANSTDAAANPYKFSGKRLETRGGANFYDFHARMLFSNLNIFNRPDPKASDYPWLSPYLYCAANPIRNIDPTGEFFINHAGEQVSYDIVSGKWTGNVDPEKDRDLILYAKFMVMSETGKKLLKEINDNDIKTTVEFKDYYRTEKGIDSNKFGEAIVDYKGKNKANIFIYTQAIAEAIPLYIDTNNKFNNEIAYTRQVMLITIEQFISSVCAHEGRHATDLEDLMDVGEINSKKYNRREDRAKKVEKKVLQEFMFKSPNKSNK